MRKIFLAFLIPVALSSSLSCAGDASKTFVVVGKNKWDIYKELNQSHYMVGGINKRMYVKKTPLTMTYEIPMAGYLNILAIDADDKTTVLFPNKYHRDNQVEKGQFNLPTKKMKFRMEADAPYGKTAVVAIITKEKINIYDKQQAQGEQLDDSEIFVSLSKQGSENLAKSFYVIAADETGETGTSSPSDNTPPSASSNHTIKVNFSMATICESKINCVF